MPLPARLAASSGAPDFAPGSFVVSARLAGKHNLPVGLQTVRDVQFDLFGQLLVVDEGTGGNGRAGSTRCSVSRCSRPGRHHGDDR